ncbi:MAG TPA: efflux RND transporter permease subunit, partial [Duganella sp.]
EGGEFYRPMAIAIIGGTITSTVLTLLMVPTFYDSIEISKDNLAIKFRRRVDHWNGRAGVWGTAVAVALTVIEVLLFLTLIRFVFRMVMWVVRKVTGKSAAAPVAAPVVEPTMVSLNKSVFDPQ